jgi:hypothetical protein
VDVVVTVPKAFEWDDFKGLTAWAAEGCLPGDPDDGELYEYSTWGGRPSIEPGGRVYVLCEERIRGYAPLVELRFEPREPGAGLGRVVFIRGGGAVAVTIPMHPIIGFRGWRYRWWDHAEEIPFPDWLGEDREAEIRQAYGHCYVADRY